jgi:hypothetical protein
LFCPCQWDNSCHQSYQLLLLPAAAAAAAVAPQEQFAVFIAGVCDDFGMSPGSSISQDQFMAALKAQLRAAAGATSASPAAAAAAAAGATSASPSVAAAAGVPATGTPKVATPRAMTAAAAAAAAESKAAVVPEQQQQQQQAGPLSRTSAFAPYSTLDSADDDTAAAPEGECPVAAALAAAAMPAVAQAAAAECKQAGDSSKECKQAAAAIFRAAAEDPKVAAAAETLATASSAEMDAMAAACAADEAAGRSSCSGNLNVPAYSPGMLTCAAARLRQNALLRQSSIKRQPAAAAGVASVLPPAAADGGNSTANTEAMQQVAKYRQALSRFRSASKVVLAANASAANGLQQLREARQLRTASQMCNASAQNAAAAAGVGSSAADGSSGMGRIAGQCTTLEQARSLCLNQLADFLMMQHLQVRLFARKVSVCRPFHVLLGLYVALCGGMFMWHACGIFVLWHVDMALCGGYKWVLCLGVRGTCKKVLAWAVCC